MLFKMSLIITQQEYCQRTVFSENYINESQLFFSISFSYRFFPMA